ncbi:SDR family oxidoreductase [Streptomyces sp. NPDC002790]|uniref:SDR family NAD(P)-dependent oxidoreductase n=1 Tax=Streptomyces sp. NPDC002790 TaxID=3154431 RepID=UPI003323A643
MDLQLRGKVAVVTGASGEIGSAVVRQLAAEGMHVALVARNAERLDALARELTSSTDVMTVSADTTDPGSVRAMADAVQGHFGRCDVLVNAASAPASASPPASLADLSADDMLRDIDCKVLGAFRCIQALVPLMASGGGGHIVNISGLNARRTGSLSGSVRNVAVAALTKNLADELGPVGINVTVVHPGVVDSPAGRDRLGRLAAESDRPVDELLRDAAGKTSLGRLFRPEDVADVVTFLASGRSGSMSGDAVAVGGGERGVIHY